MVDNSTCRAAEAGQQAACHKLGCFVSLPPLAVTYSSFAWLGVAIESHLVVVGLEVSLDCLCSSGGCITGVHINILGVLA